MDTDGAGRHNVLLIGAICANGDATVQQVDIKARYGVLLSGSLRFICYKYMSCQALIRKDFRPFSLEMGAFHDG